MLFHHVGGRFFAGIILTFCVAEIEGTCSEGWDTAPSGACWKVTKSDTWWTGCYEECGNHALACITNDAEADFAGLLVAAAVEGPGNSDRSWIGNVQSSTKDGPDANWDLCPNKASVSYTRWAPAGTGFWPGGKGAQPDALEKGEDADE